MNKDEIIAMARDAGFKLADNATDEAVDRFTSFAALVAAKERGMCAQVCTNKAMRMEQEAQAADCEDDSTSLRSSAWLISVCAAAIRARAP